jgi:EpsI family protein
VPIAVVLNALRIWATALLSVHVSPEAAQGFFHLFEGFVFFAIGALVLLGWARVLDGLVPRRQPSAPAAPPARPIRPDRPFLRGIAAVWAIVALAGTACGAERMRARLDGQADMAAVGRMAAAVSDLPLEVGDYRGERQVWEEATVKASGADAYGAVRYEDRERHTYDLFVGGALRNDENFHAPNVCMPSAGWETLLAADVSLRGGGEAAVPVRQLLLQRGAGRMLIYYWFQAGDRLASSEWAVRGYRLLDLIQGRELSPTLIISVYVPVEEDVATADAAARRFLATLAPHLRAAICSGGIHG